MAVGKINIWTFTESNSSFTFPENVSNMVHMFQMRSYAYWKEKCCRNKEKNHEHPEFYHLLLDEWVLDLAMKKNADWLCFNFNPDDNSSWTYTAYRHYTMWCWGHLGRGNRKSIPESIVNIIRERFPHKFGNYRVFLDKDDEMTMFNICVNLTVQNQFFLKCKKCLYFWSMVRQCLMFLNH